MASPNYDNLNIRLSVALDDEVVSASTDGADHRSSDRCLYLNQGSLWLWNFFLEDFTKKFDSRNLILNRFSDFLVCGVYTTQDPGGHFSTQDSFIVEIISASREDGTDVKVIRKQDVTQSYSKDADTKPSKSKPYIYISDASLVSSAAAAQVKLLPDDSSSGNLDVDVTMTYLKKPDTSRTAGYSTDIEWNISFWDTLTEAAVAMMIRYKFGRKEQSEAYLQRIAQRFFYKENLLASPITKRGQ